MGLPPLVTIAIPVYNTEPNQLQEAVSSALGQDYPRVEVVVVDDGSTRLDTVNTVKQLTGVTTLRQDNAGAGAATNAGIRVGSGQYVLLLGSDDIITPGTVTALVETLNSGEEVVIAHPVVELFGTETGTMQTPDEARLEDILIYNCIVATSLMRREHWELGGGFDEHADCSEDWGLWAAILGRTGGKAVKAYAATLHYRRTGNTMNIINRQRDKVRNARCHIAEALPGDTGKVYSAMLIAYHAAEDELAQERADARKWRQIAPMFEPVLKVRRLMILKVGRRIR